MTVSAGGSSPRASRSRAEAGRGADAKISPDLRALVAASRAEGEDGAGGDGRGRGGGRVNVIVQQDGAPGRGLDSLLRSVGGRVTRRFERLGALSVSLPPEAIAALAARADVRYVSPH